MNTPIDISNVTLKTNRMIIRPWRQPDLDDFYEYASVDGVGQMAGWRPHKDKAESQTILDMFIAEKKTFALEYEGKVIGSLGIERYNEKQFPELSEYRGREIGYVLSKAYWGLVILPDQQTVLSRSGKMRFPFSEGCRLQHTDGHCGAFKCEYNMEKRVDCQVRSTLHSAYF